MPALRPKRRRIRAIAIIIFGKTIEKLDNEEDESVFEVVDVQLSRVLQMFNDTTEGAWGMNEQAVDAAFDALADYVEENEEIDEQTLEERGDELQTALDNL